MKIPSLIIFFFACTLLSCKTKEELSIAKLFSSYNRNIDVSKSVIIIIPIDGCGACIASSIKFFEENSNLPYLYVVASTLEKKKFDIYFHEKGHDKPNFIADINCISDRLGLVGTAPNVFFMDKGRIMQIVTVTKDNNDAVLKKISSWH